MRKLTTLVIACVAILAALAAGAAQAATPAWTTYRHDAFRTGIDPDSTLPLPPSPAWQTVPLDGKLYAQPLVYGSRVYAATENDTIYALDAATGGVVWVRHLAAPQTTAPCGDIGPTIGITGTPVIDPATNRIYAVAAETAGTGVIHQLFAVDLATGTVVPGFPISADPPGSNPADQLERGALTLNGGRVVIPYGGNDGDCGTYWGWLASLPASGSGSPYFFQADSRAGDRQGAIWGAGTGPAVDGSGRIWATTSNGSSSSFDYSDSVIALNSSMQPTGFWAPTDWLHLDQTDTDLGSSEPVLLSDNLVLQTGKDGNAYLINGAAPGGVGSPLYTLSICPGGESLGGSVFLGWIDTIYTACSNGLRAMTLNPSAAAPSLALKPGFTAPSDAIGPPIFAGGLVWVTAWSAHKLYGLNPSSGAVAFQYPLSSVEHFATPSAGGQRLFLGAGDQVLAFTIAAAPPPPPARPAPSITHARLIPSRGRARGRDLVRFSLSERATVKVRLIRLVSGHRRNGQCRIFARRGRRCTARLQRGHWALRARAGTVRFRFRLRGLPPGHYNVTLVASAYGKSSRTVTLRLRIVRR